ncbi:MAG: hypothetical protein ACE5J5_06495 [Candidatus Hydrothermarchaeales archaeon]
MNRKDGIKKAIIFFILILVLISSGCIEESTEEDASTETMTRTPSLKLPEPPQETQTPTIKERITSLSEKEMFYPKKPAQLFSKESFWNQPLPENPKIDPKSEEMINALKYVFDSGEGEDFVLTRKEWTNPVYMADKDTPRVDVPLLIDWSPLPDMKLKNVPIPSYAREDPALGDPDDEQEFNIGESMGDAQMVIIDTETNTLYEFWQARQIDENGKRVFTDEERKNAKWVASWGISSSIESDGIYPCGMSARGVGSSLIAGMVWPEELEAGLINHKLEFSYPYNNIKGPVGIFRENDGWISEERLKKEAGRADIYPIPEGAIVQLDPSIDLDSFEVTDPKTGEKRALKPYEKTIAEAMQEYGMVNVDNAGTIEIQLISEESYKPFGKDPYKGLLPGDTYVFIPREFVANTRVLEMGPFQENLNSLTEEQWKMYSCNDEDCQPDPDEICER